MRELQVLGTNLQVQQADGLWCICVQFGSFQSKPREKLLQPVPQGRSLSPEGPLQAQPAQMLQVTTVQQDGACGGGNQITTMQEQLLGAAVSVTTPLTESEAIWAATM